MFDAKIRIKNFETRKKKLETKAVELYQELGSIDGVATRLKQDEKNPIVICSAIFDSIPECRRLDILYSLHELGYSAKKAFWIYMNMDDNNDPIHTIDLIYIVYEVTKDWVIKLFNNFRIGSTYIDQVKDNDFSFIYDEITAGI